MRLRRLRLQLSTPTKTVLDLDVRGVTAECPDGRFGVRPGGEPLLATIVPGILTYRGEDDVERFVAVGRGVLRAERDAVRVAVRDAVVADALEGLGEQMIDRVRTVRDGERAMEEAVRSMMRRFVEGLVEQERAR